MKHLAYPEYKDSGVQWLGQVPGHWEVKKVRYLARFKGGSTPSTGEAQFWDDGDIPWVSPKDMKSGRIVDTQDHLTAEGVAQCASGLIASGHVVIVVRSGILRHTLPVAINDVPVALNQDIRAFKINSSLIPEYLRWFIEGNQKALLEQWCKSGTTVESIEMEYLAGSHLPVPPGKEQTTISDFLDRETGRIDTLVAKKRRLIALLKEKRTALISRTVTRGLPEDAAREFGFEPHARFKDSGIEWLGQVPDGWEPIPLKYIAGIQTGYAFSSDDFIDEGIPVLRIGDITKDGSVDFTNAKYLPENYKNAFGKVLIAQGSIVMAMTGATIGKAGKYNLNDPALLNQRVCSFYSTGDNDQNFLWYLLNADFYLEHISLTAFGGAQPNISDKELLGCVVAVAPAAEQSAIAIYLDRETAKIDRLMAKVKAAINRLQEYRTALITAAVTGKIDIREVAV